MFAHAKKPGMAPRASKGTLARAPVPPGPSWPRPRPAMGSNLPAAAAELVRSDAGHLLEPGQRAFFESRLQTDFSQVRVHSGPRAADSARLLGAEAFTAGRDVVVDSRGAGVRDDLLAHELVHVAQQARAPAGAAALDGGLADPLERQAHQIAGASIGPGLEVPARLPAAAPAVQRRIAPEDVAVEMVGRSFELNVPFAPGGPFTGRLRAGDPVMIVAWDNASPDATVFSPTVVVARMPVPFSVPKRLLVPARTAVPGVSPYGAGVARQEAAVEAAENKLSAWQATKGAYTTPKGADLYQREEKRLQDLLGRKRAVLNRKLIQETMFNRFDGVIKAEVDAANAAHGLRGKAALDPNLVKALLFQESQLGTSGQHLEVPPSHPVKTRFNLGQVIDSSGMALLTMMEKEQPGFVMAFFLGNLRKDLASAQAEREKLKEKVKKKKLDATETARLAELDRLAGQNWEVFIWQYRAPGMVIGFAEAVNGFFGASTPAHNVDYEFWIHMAVLWLFEKHRAGMTWPQAIAAYNGGGQRAADYRKAVVGRAGSAADAFKKGQEFVPGGI